MKQEWSNVNEKIEALRELMRERGISVYVIPTSDDHASEYVGAHYKSRAFMTGFTGSAGTAVFTMDTAGLWTDGRYFVQAEKQIAGTQVVLYRMAEPDVPTVKEFVEEHLPPGGIIGFDGACMAARDFEKYKEIASAVGGGIEMQEDLVDILWKNRPTLPQKPVWILQSQYAGVSAEDKISDIREKMREVGATHHIIGSLYDIAWILNLRGDDISHVPVFTSFLVISMERVVLYAFGEQWSDEVKQYLQQLSIALHPYDAIYEELPDLLRGEDVRVLLNKEVINAKLMERIPKTAEVIQDKDPSELMRSIKNDTEIANTIEAHIRDGVAVTKFIRYIKTHVGEEELSELDAEQILLRLRQEQPDFLDVSFDTISAYGANAAMMHYGATPEDFAMLQPEGMLLVDSGGHYLGGTTDITRTIVLGYISDEVKKLYTAVLQGHLRLAYAKFPQGVSGTNLDVLSREPLWAMGLDYRCGTGHGVGHILNVHEGPNSFRWRLVEGKASHELMAGMITTDEPGYYEDGAYGIRIENELLCVPAEKTEYGSFLQFQQLTFAPIDLDAVVPEQMSTQERDWLNQYHAQVFEKISPYLDEDEKEWLKYETRAI